MTVTESPSSVNLLVNAVREVETERSEGLDR